MLTDITRLVAEGPRVGLSSEDGDTSSSLKEETPLVLSRVPVKFTDVARLDRNFCNSNRLGYFEVGAVSYTNGTAVKTTDGLDLRKCESEGIRDGSLRADGCIAISFGGHWERIEG